MTRRRMAWSALGSLFFLAVAGAPARLEGQNVRPKVDIPALIDRLTEVGDSDIGYSPYVTGSVFTPLDARGAFHVGMLFQKPPVPSDVVHELVKRGAAAVPHLLQHLDDRRKTGIRISHDGGAGGLWVTDEDKDLRKDRGSAGGRVVTLRVGDLCYVALGQIVNRSYDAVRYEPTLIVIVDSPVRSTALRKDVQKEWNGLTPEKHRASLVKDLESEEYLDSGACKRLAYYYPDALEGPVLKILAEPTYDFFMMRQFVQDRLYKAKTPVEARGLFDAFLKEHGEAYRYGIMAHLYDDLGTLEANEEKRLFPPLQESGEQPRQLLVQLFAKDRKVRSTDQPRRSKSGSAWTTGGLSFFIENGLLYDDSARIDGAIRKMLSTTKHDDIALACIKRLVGRGFDADINAYLRRRPPNEYFDERFKEITDRLGWSRLHVAVEQSWNDRIEGWIAQGKAVDTRGNTGDTPLHVAARSGNARAADLLVAGRAGLDAHNRAGRTPVQLAIAQGHLELARKLLDRGCAIPDVFVAAYAGRVDLLDALLKADRPAVHETTTRPRWTPLHLAAWAGRAKAVTFLLERGAWVNVADADGYTPLHLACSQGHEEVVSALLAKRASTTAETSRSELQPLHLATLNGRLGVARLLVARGASVTAKVRDSELSMMHLAAHAGHPDLLAYFHSRGLPVDALDKKKMTPLHYAAERGHKGCAEFLIANKADVNRQSDLDLRPLHLAVKGGHLEVVALLLKHHADVSPKEAYFSATPLQMAISREEPEIAELLKKHGAKK